MPWPNEAVRKIRELGYDPLFHERWIDGSEFYSGKKGESVIILDEGLDEIKDYDSLFEYQVVIDNGNIALEPFEEEVFDGNI
jgi:hypothetical protein